jgi:hypothetical protein
MCRLDELSCQFHKDWFLHSEVDKGETQTGWRWPMHILGKWAKSV